MMRQDKMNKKKRIRKNKTKSIGRAYSNNNG